MIKVVLFDLDGTLLPMDQDEFVKAYFGLLANKLAPHGYEPELLVKSIWQGTGAMIKNDGSCLNEQAFWDAFTSIYGVSVLDDIPKFDEFYRNEFLLTRECCGHNPKAAQVVRLIKEKGLRIALATNPIFPAVATEARISFAGLSPSDFELYTTYENSSYCKPNPKYYLDIVKQLNVTPEECLMVGNDVTEDMVAESIGMSVFLLTDCIINKENKDISVYNHGGFDELISLIDSL